MDNTCVLDREERKKKLFLHFSTFCFSPPIHSNGIKKWMNHKRAAKSFFSPFSKEKKWSFITISAGTVENQWPRTYVGLGMPDFSWYNIPKREKYTNWPNNVLNGHKIYQITTKYTI
jgi:hypothetical protein